MVIVAQLAERQIVVLEVAGSNPVFHPSARHFIKNVGLFCDQKSHNQPNPIKIKLVTLRPDFQPENTKTNNNYGNT